jgi:hypothetical protein
MERYCSTGQSPQQAVVPMEEEEKEEEKGFKEPGDHPINWQTKFL